MLSSLTWTGVNWKVNLNAGQISVLSIRAPSSRKANLQVC